MLHHTVPSPNRRSPNISEPFFRFSQPNRRSANINALFFRSSSPNRRMANILRMPFI